MFRIILSLLFLIINGLKAEENTAYEAGMNALGGSLIGFTSQGYPGAIVGGVGQLAYYLMFEDGKISTTDAYLKADTKILTAKKIDNYRIINPYNNETVWIGNLKNGELYRDIEGRLIFIKD